MLTILMIMMMTLMSEEHFMMTKLGFLGQSFITG